MNHSIIKNEYLDPLYEAGTLSRLDIHFAAHLVRLAGRDMPELALAAALASSYTRQGHVCLDLSDIQGKKLPERDDGEDVIVCPELKAWDEKLRESDVVGAPGEYKPLIHAPQNRRRQFFLIIPVSVKIEPCTIIQNQWLVFTRFPYWRTLPEGLKPVI